MGELSPVLLFHTVAWQGRDTPIPCPSSPETDKGTDLPLYQLAEALNKGGPALLMGNIAELTVC